MRDSSDVDNCPRCQKCDRWRTAPDYLREPMILWERFPCPPPGTDHARLLLELDWTGQIGTNDGCEALKRVAKRCHVDLKRIDTIPVSLVECEELFDVISFCGTQCVIAVILACICLLFFLLLIVVCVRYVKRTEKESSRICTKVLTPEHTAVNTQINKYYVQNQYFHRPSNIPGRRGLPCEARLVENGVEARLLKAIHEVPVQYNVEDLCPQCLAESRQGSLRYCRNRPGYESICWKDKDYIQKRVPSNDSLNRKSFNSHRSANGSSSDVSHHYEYISDYPYAPSYNSVGRKSSYSTNFNSRNNSINLRETQYAGDLKTPTDTETDTTQKLSDRDSDTYNRNEQKQSRRSITSIHSRYDDRGPYRYWTERSPYQPTASDKSAYHRNVCDRALYKGYFSDTPHDRSSLNPNASDSASVSSKGHTTDGNEIKNMVNHILTAKAIADQPKDVKGYKYTLNPSFNDYSTKTPVSNKMPNALPTSPSDIFQANNVIPDNSASRQPSHHKRKGRNRSKSTDSYNSTCSESTSLSDSFGKSNGVNNTRRNRNFYNSTKTSEK